MESILFLAHTEADGSLTTHALETLNAAISLAAAMGTVNLTVGLIGDAVTTASASIGTCGAQRFFGVSGVEFAQPRYATDALAAEAIVRAAQATLILAPASARWNRVLPGVAARLHGKVDTHVNTVNVTNGKPTINRWYYRQRMEAVQQRAERPWLMLMESGCYKAWQGESMPVTVESLSVAVSTEHQRTNVIGIQAPPLDQQTIRPDALLLFVAGAGWTKKQPDGQCHVKEAEQLILEFIHRTRASLGSSKSLVDISGEGQAVLSCLSHLNQIGQTGSTPRHPKGLSTCCHGEEPHTVGWRFINERRAINLDPNCGWARGKADVLYLADAFAVMARVNQLLD